MGTTQVQPNRGRQAGLLLRSWREHRRLSQLELALRTGISARHVSFVENGRSRPSAELIERFGDQLDIPLRDRNQVLLTAGYAPGHAETSIDAPEMAPVREALDLVLAGQEPYPAIVVDRRWNLVAANRAVGLFIDGVDPALLEPPVNVLRLSFHPDGLASRTVNLAEFRSRLLALVERQVVLTADRELTALLAELRGYPAPDDDVPEETAAGAVFVPMRLRYEDRVLSFFNTLTTFGTPLDITLAELCVESFFPADRETAEVLRALAERNLQ